MGIVFAMQGAVAQGVLWGIMTLGVFITFRVLDSADMTVDGSFALGGAVSAILIVHGMDPVLSLLIAVCAGMIAGLITGLLHTKFLIHGILAGILTQLALYSVNIRIMGRANIPLLGVKTIFTRLREWFPGMSVNTACLLMGVIISLVIILFLYWFFGTEVGSSIRATGCNERMARAVGVNTDYIKILGLMISNGLVSLSGALVAQSQGYADVGMGTGAIVIGLASIIIGEVVFGKHFGFWYYLLSVLLGSVVYRIIIAVVLQLGLKSTDLKLLTAVIVAFALALPVLKKKLPKKEVTATTTKEILKEKAPESAVAPEVE